MKEETSDTSCCFAAIVADKEVFVYLGFQEFDLISLKVNIVKWIFQISLVGFV